jgi:DUF1680 family protein
MDHYNQIALKDVCVQDNFFGFYRKLVKEQVIPYQWKALNDQIEGAAPSHAVENFRIAAALKQGEFYGCVFQDSDVAKWLEAAAYSLAAFPDAELEKTIDETIDIIGKAQMEDGYLNTYYIVKEPGNRWTNLKENHELYCAGHMIEAAVAYYEVTGKKNLLDIVCKYADHIDSVFGPQEGKLRGYPGHQEIELALIRLYRVTRREKYLNLALYFLLERGKQPHYFLREREKRDGGAYDINALKYCQAHESVVEQKEAVGHSVRAAYMYTGMADAAIETGDENLLKTCRVLWDNIQNKKLYIHGGIGSVARIEGFTGDYDLPNDFIYAETCASIALIFFAQKMLILEKLSKYADVMERALYNSVLSSMSVDGKGFFYVNPLEADPYIIDNNVSLDHVKYVRQKWFGCACCPPNVARLLASIGNYIYTKTNDSLYVDLYIGSELKSEINGKAFTVKLETSMPYGGESKLTFASCEAESFTAALRIPEWAGEYAVFLNNAPVNNPVIRNGYLCISRTWNSGDVIKIDFKLKPVVIRSNPQVRNNLDKIAIQRGPLLYCLEEADNGKGLCQYEIDPGTLREYEKELCGGKVICIEADGRKRLPANGSGKLYYLHDEQIAYTPVKGMFIPYFLWANRQPGEMTVWCYGPSK